MTQQNIRRHRVELDEKVKIYGMMLKWFFAPEKHYGKNAQEALLLARMWMGKLLGVIGETYPYPNSMNAENAVVDAPADSATVKADDVLPGLDMVTWTKLQRIDVEKMVQEWLKVFAQLNSKDVSADELLFLCTERVIVYLMEANMWLGMELQAQNELRKDRDASYAAMRGEEQPAAGSAAQQ